MKFNPRPTVPSYLHVNEGGYVAVIGWSIKLVESAVPSICVRFTYENSSHLRADDFHVNLIRTAVETYSADSLRWVPIPEPT